MINNDYYIIDKIPITAYFLPLWSALSICCNNVVFPAPRKPDSTVTGSFFIGNVDVDDVDEPFVVTVACNNVNNTLGCFKTFDLNDIAYNIYQE